MEPSAYGSAPFSTTCWTNVLSAARPDSLDGRDAFGALYRDYWRPLYAYLRRKGHAPAEAEDLLQDFFVTLLERERLAGLEREGGKFRSFLLRALHNFLANAWDRKTALKRGGGAEVLSLDVPESERQYLADRPDELTADRAFERQWAFATLERVMARLEAEARAAGKAKPFAHLRPQLQGDRGGRPYAELAAELGTSEGALKVMVHRLRARYGELLREEIARTVGTPEEVAGEVRYLISVVAKP